MNKLIAEEEVVFTWPQMQLMMTLMQKYDKVSDPLASFIWSEIGLKYCAHKQYARVGYGWRFSIENKGKFMFAKIKYGF